MAYNPNPAFNPMAAYGFSQQQQLYNPQWNNMQQSSYQPQIMQQQSPQMQNVASVMQQQQQNSNGINWVQGEEGAKAYMVAPGNSVFLLDSEGSVFYIKSTDQSGMPQPLRIFDYKERLPNTPPPINAAVQTPKNDYYVTRSEFNDLAARFEALSATTKDKDTRSRKATKEKEKDDEQPAV